MKWKEWFRSGLAILKGSWAVLRGQPELIILPLVSAVAIVGLFGAFIAVEVTTPTLPKMDQQIQSPWLYAALFAIYLTCAFVVVFCNAALVYCAQRGFEGRRATLGEGLAAAGRRWPQILVWSVISATLGLLLKLAFNALRSPDSQKKLGIIATLIALLVVAVADMAWVTATYFVLPIMVVEGIGPFAAIKRSAELIRQRWGEVMVGEGGLGGIAILVFLPLFAIACVLIVATNYGVTTALVIVAAVDAAAIVLVSAVFVALGVVFTAGIYIYAASGAMPAPFGPELVSAAFKSQPPKSTAEK